MLYEDKEDEWSRETEQSNMFSLYYVTDNNNLLSVAGVHLIIMESVLGR